MTTKNIFNHPNFNRARLDRVRRFIDFTTSGSSMEKIFTISYDGQIVQTDEHGFIKNPHDVNKETRSWMFFSTDEDKLRDAWIIAQFSEQKHYLTCLVWKTRFNYVSENLVILEKLLRHLDRQEVRIQYVTSYDRQDNPVGTIKSYHVDDLANLRTRVVPLF